MTKQQLARWIKNLPKKDDKIAIELYQQAINRPDVQKSLAEARSRWPTQKQEKKGT